MSTETADPITEEGPGADASEEAEGALAAGAVCLLDPALPPEESEALATKLGRPVLTVDPRQLGEDLEPLHGALAIVVPWDVGIQHGLDLVETVRRCEPTRAARVLVAAVEPTRSMVLAALRAGADGFVFRPYEADELGARLAEQPQPDAATEGGGS